MNFQELVKSIYGFFKNCDEIYYKNLSVDRKNTRMGQCLTRRS